jgi:phosphocarrier protein HPr
VPEQTVVLPNESGLHARPAKVFARRAKEKPCEVQISKGDRDADAKSVLSVLTLDVVQGDEVTIRTEGDDAEAALADLVDLVENGLEEVEEEEEEEGGDG